LDSQTSDIGEKATVDNAKVNCHIVPVPDPARYAIGDLAELGGVSRRTVRYYVQEGLLPAPLGVGRGNHYGPEHLDQLQRVKSLQEQGRTLDEIRAILHGRSAEAAAAAPPQAHLPVARTVWRRLLLAPGVELHLSSDVRPPSPAALSELASWCRIHLSPVREHEDPHE
jgi:DNA-binding transcriptional MerR regulator